MNVKLMNAQKAYNESRHRGEANEILENIVKGIEKMCENGKFRWEENISRDYVAEVTQLVLEDLKNAGYKADIKLGNDKDFWAKNTIIIDWDMDRDKEMGK